MQHLLAPGKERLHRTIIDESAILGGAAQSVSAQTVGYAEEMEAETRSKGYVQAASRNSLKNAQRADLRGSHQNSWWLACLKKVRLLVNVESFFMQACMYNCIKIVVSCVCTSLSTIQHYT